MALRLNDYDAIGFDVDHALVRYRLENLFPLVYHCLAKFLVETKDYPKELLEEPFDKYADFCVRGLILETDRGNVVKISKDGKVLRASHGTKIMSEEKLKEEYGEKKKWEPFHDCLTELKNKGNFLHGAKFRMLENFFDMPVVLLYARVIDIVDREEAGKEKYHLIWPDLLSSFIENFDFRSFKADKGYFFPSVKADIQKYVRPCSDKLKEWLKRLRKDGRKLFLITNSQADFSMFVLENAFGKDWLSYFNVAVSRAGKPGFFKIQRPFLEVVNGVAGKDEIRDLEEGHYYAEGNSTDLERFIGKLTNKTDVKVLFFGDSLVSDVYPPEHFANWNTAALLEEMAVEDNSSSTLNQQQQDMENNSSREPDTKKPKFSEDTVNDKEDVKKLTSFLQSSVWGSIFGENDDELVNSLFGNLIDEYSSLVIPSLDYLAELNTDHSFVNNSNSISRFYPAIPGRTIKTTETRS